MQTSLFKSEIALQEVAILKIKPNTIRERLLLNGSDSLSNTELLSLILCGNTKKLKVTLAREIFELSGNSLNAMARHSVADLMKIDGIGEIQACAIVAAFTLNRRRSLEIASKVRVTSSRNAFDILQPLIADCNYEEFYVLFLNRANNVINYKRISDGGITGTVVDIRRVFKLALECHATSLILAHNHPSGNLYPSEADNLLTRKIKAAGEVMDILVRDHLIVGCNGYYSYADDGVL
jgi:DNA repair protein RadC